MTGAPFDRYGPPEPITPLVVSVPHGGRAYPDALLAALAVPCEALLPLEDRHVDTLARAALPDAAMIVARRPRAWIDLNRAEHERDPRIDDGALPTAMPLQSAKVRGGLGLIPRRASGTTSIWSRRFAAAEVMARIAADHRPYHAALATMLAAARARFGIAVLLDVHSMPPIGGSRAAQVVVGDRFGRSAAARLGACVEGVARRAGLRVALNSPYAGGHILDRHGRPAQGIHALQVEIDRTLYLDAALRAPGNGFETAARLLADIAAVLVDDVTPLAAAAE